MFFSRKNRQRIFKSLGVILVLISTAGYAQDIESVIKAPILTNNGGLSFSQIGSYIPGDTLNRINPYSYYISGNMNFSLFSVVNVPVSFAYTNNQLNTEATLPFNRFSIAPSYKWITLYAGYASMTFSPYTLVGHETFGGGVELKFDNGFKFSAIYGRLQKEVRPDSAITSAAYQRMGGGFKVEYGHEKADISLNIYKAKDVVNNALYSDSTLTPKDNISGSLYLDIKMIDNFKLNVEYAISAINADISRSDSVDRSFKDNFLESNGDLSVHHALKAGISQTSPIGVVGATYERVSPNYTTLGAYYFVNDFENITANYSTTIKKVVNIALDAGYQNDNISKQKMNTNNRFIFSSNVSSTITKRLSVGASYSNLKSYVHIRDIYKDLTNTNPFQNIDTLSFTQLNLTTSGNVNYILRSTNENRQNLNVSFTYQEASEQQDKTEKYTGSKIYNSALSYQFSLIPQKFNASTSVSYNHNNLSNGFMGVFSYNLSLQKVIFEQLKLAITGTYSRSFNDSSSLANVMNIRFSAGYTFQKRHNLNLSIAGVSSHSMSRENTQYTANLSYNYMFDFNLRRKDKKFNFEGNF